MKREIDAPIALLAVAAFLTPVMGGQVPLDAVALPPGANAWWFAVTGAAATAMLSHALLSFLCAAALVTAILQRKILQMPNSVLGGAIIVLLALVMMSVGLSQFRGVSLPAAIEWLTYGIAFYAVVAVGGRQRGPYVILAALFAGCVLLALLGLREFGELKAQDPSMRLQTQWNNPNAMGTMLIIGMLVGFALAVNAKRAAAIGIAFGCVAIGLAMFLTQSKGAFLAVIAGVVFFAILVALWLPRRDTLRAAGLVGGTLAVVFLLALAIAFQPKAGSAGHAGIGPIPGARLVDVGASAEQSVGFRKLLWQSALKLIEQNPFGSGANTFQYESSRPGLVTQTHFAHEAYLQLGEESSVLAPLLLIFGLGWWARLACLGGRKLPAAQNALRAGVFSAVAAIAGHSLVDSDLSYYGIGLAVFLLLGLGLSLSSDAVAPEFIPKPIRYASAAGVALTVVVFGYLGITDEMRAEARGFMNARTLNDSQRTLESLRSLTPWNAEVWYLSGAVSEDAKQRLEFAKDAAALGPSDRNLRFLAETDVKMGLYTDAVNALQQALLLDPNNMPTLTLLAEIQHQMGLDQQEQKTLWRLVAVEQTSYFTVRSLPELVPTETYVARIRLAELAPDDKARATLLQPAVDGFKQYLALTVPNVLRFAANSDGALPYAGETLDIAEAKMTQAAAAARLLAKTDRALGDNGKADAADADAGLFEKPLKP